MITKVVGVTFANEDGSSRADVIATMNESDPIVLERDPFNEYDSNAVKVCVVQNGVKKQFGNLGRDLAAVISPRMRRGETFKAFITSCGFYMNRPYCEICIDGI